MSGLNFNPIERLEDLIFSEVISDKEQKDSIRKLLNDKLRNGKIAFFLDGLDEISETNDPSVSLHQLFNKFIQSDNIDNNLVIVTTRPYALKERFFRYQVHEMEIAPFNMAQIKQFVTHYYNNNYKIKKFLADLAVRTELQDIARVPLILGFLVQMYINNEKYHVLSKNKLDLYDQIVNVLNDQWDDEKGVIRNFKINSIRRREFLSQIAFSRLFNFKDDFTNRLVFTSQELFDEAEIYCKDKPFLNSDNLLEDVKATALLRKIGGDLYSFIHLTIQEFLAANILRKNKNIAKIFCHAYSDPVLSEMEVLPMTLGLSQSNIASKENLYELLKNLPESLNFANFRLRVRGLNYSTNVDKKYLSELFERLLEFIMEKNIFEPVYKEIVIRAFAGIVEENRKYISKRLSQYLKEYNTQLSSFSKCNVIFALGQLQATEAIPQLLEMLQKDDDVNVRIYASRVLGELQVLKQYLNY